MDGSGNDYLKSACDQAHLTQHGTTSILLLTCVSAVGADQGSRHERTIIG
jgi:hypothetical protein